MAEDGLNAQDLVRGVEPVPIVRTAIACNSQRRGDVFVSSIAIGRRWYRSPTVGIWSKSLCFLAEPACERRGFDGVAEFCNVVKAFQGF